MNASKLRVYARLQRAAHLLSKAADRELLSVAGITTAQAAVLAVISENDAQTQKFIANALSLNESAVVAMAGRLEGLGLLSRTRSADDGRAWVISLTAKGKRTLSQVAKPFAAINTKIEAAVSPDDLAAFAGILDRLRKQFED
tara:strand:+ start:11872 stop:12300 length:429 start_codon:yes stop_codon:yes gene_type:complete